VAKSKTKVSKTASARVPAARKKTKSAAVTTKATARTRRTKVTARAPAARVPRRAVFIDVENTSSEASLFETIESLAIDRSVQPTELAAVGNWRTVGPTVGRRLGALGAQLVHSAPARGVRDWSDLWIAVAAGCWLGQAAPGDVLEIVSNDRAFDAVADAAAARGVIFRRLQHRHGATVAAESAEARTPSARGGRRRGGRSRGQRRPAAVAAPTRPAAPVRPPAAQTASASAGPHGASAVQMAELIQRLTNGEPGRWINLDVLEKALKSEGFARPPGSPRLVTRLRALKEMEIDSHGRVRLRQSAEDAMSKSAG
jgi:hypothetical protein